MLIPGFGRLGTSAMNKANSISNFFCRFHSEHINNNHVVKVTGKTKQLIVTATNQISHSQPVFLAEKCRQAAKVQDDPKLLSSVSSLMSHALSYQPPELSLKQITS